MNNNSSQTVAIIGGGLAGSLMSLMLAQKGFNVKLYEGRENFLGSTQKAGRSINLGLSFRGLCALKRVGVAKTVLESCVKMKGRMVHNTNGNQTLMPYGKSENEILYSIDRNELNRILLREAILSSSVEVFFEHKLESIDNNKRELTLKTTSGHLRVTADWVVGADGAFSRTRAEMHKGMLADYSQEFLKWGYKELTLHPGKAGQSVIEPDVLHAWPRGDALIVTHPNLDQSHTLTVFLPYNEKFGFNNISSENEIKNLFEHYFPDLLPFLPNLISEWQNHPIGNIVTVKTNVWHYDDWIVLVGDSAHAQYPFLGQGMNSAFEDCITLIDSMNQVKGSRVDAFNSYFQARKMNTDVLSDLSKSNFDELRNRIRSPLFIARKNLDLLVHKIFPGNWIPLYSLISHTTIPYSVALERAKLQNRLLNFALLFVGSLIILGIVIIFRKVL